MRLNSIRISQWLVKDLFQSFSNDSRLKGQVPSDSPSTMCKYLLINEAIWLCYGLLRILTELLSQRFPLSPPHSEISSWVCEATRRGGYILCEYIIPCQGLHLYSRHKCLDFFDPSRASLGPATLL